MHAPATMRQRVARRLGIALVATADNAYRVTDHTALRQLPPGPDGLALLQPDNGDVQFQLGTVAGARMIVLQRLERAEEAVEAGREAVRRREAALALQPGNVAYRDGLAGEQPEDQGREQGFLVHGMIPSYC